MPPDPQIHCSHEEGVRYRDGVYLPVDADALPAAPAPGPEGPRAFPDPGHGPPLRRLDGVPRVPRLRDVVGPSVIALGMGLGAGEFLLWPNLIAVNGFSIWWLFWIGVLTQFVVIGEIERWTLATGESVFAGMARLTRVPFWPWFFLVATIVSFFWPGWAAESADFTRATINAIAGREALGAWQPLALAMLAFIWAALALSRIVYNALERFEIGLVLLFFPLLFVALLAAGVLPGQVGALLTGAVWIGRAPEALLSGEQFPTLLIAVAYAGSGGTLLLAQSLWVRDKGFGMGAYQGRIAGIRGRDEPLHDPGFAFSAEDPVQRTRFRRWMGLAERELLATFVLLILASVVVTTLLVAATIGTDRPDLAGNLNGMVLEQAEVLRGRTGPVLPLLFLLGGALVLFSTQFGIVDTVTRITGDIVHERVGKRRGWTLKRTFLVLLTVVVAAGMAVVGVSWRMDETVQALSPDFLVLIAGPFTIASMYAFAVVVTLVNVRLLPPALRMPRWKLVSMYWAVVLWGWFTAETVSRVVMSQALGLSGSTVSTVAFHPVRAAVYLAWLASLAWLVARTARPGFARHVPLD
ncbi:MAG TPA: Nramp family divalent metal transporter [Gemmatimonadota bacterium]|nr:Nramp family divalent metal transporter [Gemmatimonadota bacterium]